METEGGTRVLLIEDDQEFAELYRMRLEHDGFEVHWAANGEAGVAAVAAWQPDLVLLDVWMPDLDGLEVLERLPQCLPVVMLSNFSDDAMHGRAMELGAVAWVVKVRVTPTELSQRVAERTMRRRSSG